MIIDIPVDSMMVRDASEYLGCSKEELIAWIKPDQRLADRFEFYSNGESSFGVCFNEQSPFSGARLWRKETLDAAKPCVAAWRERDRARKKAAAEAMEAKEASRRIARSGMRKGGAIMSGEVCSRLGCSLTELNRWAADKRLPPDGEVVTQHGTSARAWLPGTIETARDSITWWREQDRTRRNFSRRRLCLV